MGWIFLMQCHGVQFMSLYAASLYFHGHGMAGWQCQPHGMTGQDVAGPPTPDIGQAEESFLGGYLAELRAVQLYFSYNCAVGACNNAGLICKAA